MEDSKKFHYSSDLKKKIPDEYSQCTISMSFSTKMKNITDKVKIGDIQNSSSGTYQGRRMVVVEDILRYNEIAILTFGFFEKLFSSTSQRISKDEILYYFYSKLLEKTTIPRRPTILEQFELIIKEVYNSCFQINLKKKVQENRSLWFEMVYFVIFMTIDIYSFKTPVSRLENEELQTMANCLRFSIKKIDENNVEKVYLTNNPWLDKSQFLSYQIRGKQCELLYFEESPMVSKIGSKMHSKRYSSNTSSKSLSENPELLSNMEGEKEELLKENEALSSLLPDLLALSYEFMDYFIKIGADKGLESVQFLRCSMANCGKISCGVANNEHLGKHLRGLGKMLQEKSDKYTVDHQNNIVEILQDYKNNHSIGPSSPSKIDLSPKVKHSCVLCPFEGKNLILLNCQHLIHESCLKKIINGRTVESIEDIRCPKDKMPIDYGIIEKICPERAQSLNHYKQSNRKVRH